MAKMRESLMTELSNLRDASSVTTASQMRHMETLKEELERAQARAGTVTLPARLRAEAQAHADQLAQTDGGGAGQGRSSRWAPKSAA